MVSNTKKLQFIKMISLLLQYYPLACCLMAYSLQKAEEITLKLKIGSATKQAWAATESLVLWKIASEVFNPKQCFIAFIMKLWNVTITI